MDKEMREPAAIKLAKTEVLRWARKRVFEGFKPSTT